MPKAKNRWTRSKKRSGEGQAGKRANSNASTDDDQLTMDEFEELQTASKISVRDKNRGTHSFKVGDHIMVLGQGMSAEKLYPEHAYWVAEIKAIAPHPTAKRQAYFLVRWYWSASDIRSVARTADVDHYGQYERCLSKETDIIHSDCVNGTVEVVRFEEGDSEQRPITFKTFYVRDQFSFSKRVITALTVPQLCGICEKRYNPDDSTNPMHYCPQATCRRWYHYKCLAKRSSSGEYSSQQHHGRALMLSIPEYSPSLFSSKTRKARSSTKSTRGLVEEAAEIDPSDILSSLDAYHRGDLIQLAQQQIVRPTNEGIVGNIARVLAARRWVHEARTLSSMPSKRRTLLVQWLDKIEEETVDLQLANSSSKLSSVKSRLWVCVTCGGPI